MKSKKENEFINSTSSTELEINGERIIIGFRSKKNKKPINAIESIEKQFFKKKQAIVQLKKKNKVMSIDDIEMFLMSQATGPTKHEASFAVLNAFMRFFKSGFVFLTGVGTQTKILSNFLFVMEENNWILKL